MQLESLQKALKPLKIILKNNFFQTNILSLKNFEKNKKSYLKIITNYYKIKKPFILV